MVKIEVQRNKKIKILGEFLLFSEQPNGNNRIYDKNCICKEVFKEFKNRVKKGQVFGENFINDFDECLDVIRLNRVSHIVKKVKKNKKGIFGEVELLNTPQGNLIKELIFSGIVNFSLRLRCIGRIQDNRVHIFEVISCDFLNWNNDAFNPNGYKNRRYKLSNKMKEA